MTVRKLSGLKKKISKEHPKGQPLKVLIIGRKEAVRDAYEILDVLRPIGFDLDLLGVVCLNKKRPPNILPGIPIFKKFDHVIESEKPELIVVTVDDSNLLGELRKILPSHTRILDSFALEAFRNLKKVSGQLGTTENKLRSVELIKEVLMAGSEVSIMVVDEDFRVLDINNAILSRTKMSRQGCLGRTCHWVITRKMEPCHLRGGICPVRDVLKTGRSTHRVREEKRDDGTVRYYTISGYPLQKDEQGKKCVLIVWKDVTAGLAPVLDRQAYYMKRNFSQLRHQDKMMALGKLAAAAVHEINNPMQGILTFSKLMRASLDSGSLSPDQYEKFRSYLDLISAESARCGQILRNLLSFAKLGDLQKTSIDLNALLDEIVLLVGNRLELQNITLERDIPRDLWPVYGDRNQIKQVFLNLILNSVEAMPDGGSITISASQPDPNFVRILVSDTGEGIPETIRENIFEPFVTTKENGKGVGLGLSVVYGIVTQHGGTIEMRTGPTKGATFVFTLPVFKKAPDTEVC